MMMKNSLNSYDDLINKSLKTPPGPKLPDSFTDRLMKRVERKLAAREVMADFFLKTATALLILIILAGIYFIPEFRQSVLSLADTARQSPTVIGLVIVVLFSFILDQLVLKYFLKIRK